MVHPRWRDLALWSAALSAVTALVVVLGGTAVWWVERDAPGANLEHWGDAVWWSITTLATVGYGEHYPVTVAGRLVAVGIMVGGIGVIGAVAAVVAFGFSRGLDQRLREVQGRVEAEAEHVEHVEAEVEQMGAEVEVVAAMTGRRGPRSPARGSLLGATVSVPDASSAGCLGWLLGRFGWVRDPLPADPHGLAGGPHADLWYRGEQTLVVVHDAAAAPGRLVLASGPVTGRSAFVEHARGHGFVPSGPPDETGVTVLVGPGGVEVHLRAS